MGETPAVTITLPVQANAVFAVLPSETIPGLQEEFDFYVWDEKRDEVRFMCAWDTTEEDVERLMGAVREAVG